MALMNQTMFLKFMLFNQTRHVSDETWWMMDDGSSETCLVWLNNMNFKNIVWFIKAMLLLLLLLLLILLLFYYYYYYYYLNGQFKVVT